MQCVNKTFSMRHLLTQSASLDKLAPTLAPFLPAFQAHLLERSPSTVVATMTHEVIHALVRTVDSVMAVLVSCPIRFFSCLLCCAGVRAHACKVVSQR